MLRVGEHGAGRKKRGGRRREKGKEKKKERRKEKEKKGGKERGPAGFAAMVAIQAWRRREAERTPNEENRKIRR
jgi:hypothetical protein